MAHKPGQEGEVPDLAGIGHELRIESNMHGAMGASFKAAMLFIIFFGLRKAI